MDLVSYKREIYLNFMNLVSYKKDLYFSDHILQKRTLCSGEAAAAMGE